MVNDEEMLDFLRKQAVGAKYVTSVCTGSLVLGAAGLLRGYRAATHWSAMDMLGAFGAIPTKTRVCIDRNRVTGGGVTAGIDFALTLVSILVDRQTAEAISAPARIQSCAAVQCRLTRDRAPRNFGTAERKNRAVQTTPARGGPTRRGAPIALSSKPAPHLMRGGYRFA